MFCKTKQLQFSDFKYIRAVWSGDSLPICPHCRKSPYDKDFELTHENQDEQGGE